MGTPTPPPDMVEASISIDAPVARVWELVSEPGWFISDEQGDRTPQRRSTRGNDVVLHDSRFGVFLFRTESVEPDRRIATRTAFGPTERDLDLAKSTLTTFTLTPRDGAVDVHVSERGFRSLGLGGDDLQQLVDGNRAAWPVKLAHLRDEAESA